jgi:tryptophanyl-tRNA synthetase
MKRVFSGIRPTGKLHLGNYQGAVLNYVKMQEEYNCVYCVVDIHALTTLSETPVLQKNINDMFLDILAAGVDPEKAVLFVQSHVPQINELAMLLGMVTPLSWLLRVPTFKEKARQHPENINYGLVGYPVLMAADILLYRADLVPVGSDQLPHLELTREIVRSFNSRFGHTFEEPQAKLTEFPLVVGLDGKDKMSKSLNNHIEVSATPEETAKRIMTAVTDPARQRKTDPGHPDVCNVFKLHQQFNAAECPIIEEECKKAGIGCVDCKKRLAACINSTLEPLRERRAILAEKPDYIEEVKQDGAKRAGVIAKETLAVVRDRMNLK